MKAWLALLWFYLLSTAFAVPALAPPVGPPPMISGGLHYSAQGPWQVGTEIWYWMTWTPIDQSLDMSYCAIFSHYGDYSTFTMPIRAFHERRIPSTPVYYLTHILTDDDIKNGFWFGGFILDLTTFQSAFRSITIGYPGDDSP